MDQLPLFFEAQLPSGTDDFELSPDTSKHIVQVLRMKPGGRLLLTDGNGIQMEVKLEVADKKKARVSFISKLDHLAPESEIAIAISLLKNEGRFEWFIEKATEIGVQAIYPLICERTERKSFREDRIKNIMISAMLQSRQVFLPHLAAPLQLNQLYSEDQYQQKFIAHCIDGDDKAELNSLSDENLSKIILIGPEGDFTSQELKIAVKEGYVPVSLGSTRLRTETAGIVAAVWLLK